MTLGPILRFDLIRTARRPRTYALRAALGAMLVGVCWLGHEGSGLWWFLGPNAAVLGRPQALPGKANVLFVELGIVEALVILALVPGLVAGSIAEEDRGGAMAELLTSPLSSGAIVLGKLGARLVHLAAAMAVALPLVVPLGLLGVIDPGLVLAVYLLLGLLAVFTATLSLCVACLVRRPGHAIPAAYLAVASWFMFPWWFAGLAGLFAPGLGWLGAAAHGLRSFHLASAAAGLAWVALARLLGEAGLAAVAWSQVDSLLPKLAAFHVGASVVLAAVACARLRPLRLGGARRPAVAAAPWRPPIGDDPMLWKERNPARSQFRAVLMGMLLVLGAIMAARLAGPAQAAFAEWRQSWSNPAGTTYWRREKLNGALRELTEGLYLTALAAVAASAATSISGERQRGTWTSIETTLLTGREVVRAKVLGAVTGVRWVVPAFAAVAAAGLATGAVHPIGVVLAGAAMAVFLTFAAALGTACSLWTRTSDQAILTAFSLLLAANTLPLLFVPLGLIGGLSGSWTTLYLAGHTPFVQWSSLLSATEIHECLAGRYCEQIFGLPGGLWESRIQLVPGLIRTYAASLALHAGAAILLIRAAARSYDARLSPRRSAALLHGAPGSTKMTLPGAFALEAIEPQGSASGAGARPGLQNR